MIDLLDFARGPALRFSIAVFVLGVVWRLVRLFLMPKPAISSVPRSGKNPGIADAAMGFLHYIRHNKATGHNLSLSMINGWAFHIGLAIIVFGLSAHIMFFKRLTGLSWYNLPSNLVYLVGVITLVSLLAALYHRLTSPVLKKISTANDYFTWFVTFAPIVTGLAATMHLGFRYEGLLAVHILSICLLLIWFPFGKLMHGFLIFITRGRTAKEAARRGVKL